MPNRKPSRGKSGNGKRPAPQKRDRANAVDMDKLREFLDEVHDLTDKMESRNAATRQNIGKAYERAAAATDLTKKAIMGAFRLERKLRKEEEQAQDKGTSKDRDSYLQLASAFGDDNPIGAWAKNLADHITDGEDEGDEADEAEEKDSAPKATVHQLRGPA